MKIDVVYKLGVGSKYNDRELRYSLRSLQQNFKDLGKVYVIGHKPLWVQNAEHIPAQDVLTSNKDGNLIHKLLIACYQPDITEQFVNMSDDQLFLNKVGYEDICIPYFDNKVSNFKLGQRLNRWERRIENTITALRSIGLPFNCFETHCPVIIDRLQFIHVTAKFDYVNNRGMCGNTLYFNSLRVPGRELDSSAVVKLNPPLSSIEEGERLCGRGKILSYTENTLNNDFLFLYLESKFPNKSIYEND